MAESEELVKARTLAHVISQSSRPDPFETAALMAAVSIATSLERIVEHLQRDDVAANPNPIEWGR